MASYRPKRCKHCGAERGDGFVISKRGLCEACAMARMTAAIRHQQHASVVADQAISERIQANRTAS